MDLSEFMKDCHEKINLHPDLILRQCVSSSVSYIRPFCLNDNENPLVGYVYVSILLCDIQWVYLRLFIEGVKQV